MTSYRVIIEDQMLWEMREGLSVLPAGFRLGETLGSAGYSTSVVRVEDDNAPPELEGHLVEPVLRQVYGEDGQLAEVRIVERRVLGHGEGQRG